MIFTLNHKQGVAAIMAKVTISEHTIGVSGGAQIAAYPKLAGQILDTSGGMQVSAAFGDGSKMIRVNTDGPICFVIGRNPTATTSDDRMATNQTEYFNVQPGDKIAVITTT